MRIICIISFLISVFTAAAQDLSSIAKHPSKTIKSAAKYAIDKNSSWKIKELDNHRFKSFNANQIINIGYNLDATVWCHFKFENQTDSSKMLYLCFQNNHLDSLQLFDGNEIRLLGDRTKFSSPYMINQTFEIQLLSKESKTIFVRVKKGVSFLDFSFSLEERNLLGKETQQKIASISFFSGIVCLLILFNGILFLVTRKRLYIFYVTYTIFTLVYVMVTTGFAKYFLFPTFLHFSEVRIYSGSLWFIGLSYFLSEFLDLKHTQKKKYYSILFLNLINLGIIILTLFLLKINQLHWIKFALNLGYVIFLAVITILLWASIAHLKINRLNATYILLSFLPHTIWVLFIILKSFKLIVNDIHNDWLVFISLYEVFLFGYVLARNYIETFKKNNALIRDIITEKEKSIVAVESAQIRERKQIANILHDNFGTKLAHISHLLEMNKMDQIQGNILELTSEIRNVSHQIMPKALDEGALVSSLKTQIEIINQGKNCNIELFDYDFPEKINDKWAYNMYLISLEIIQNALRHGKPQTVLLEFFGYEEVFVFQYTDDGKGFDSANTPKGFGLSSIESRILAESGIFEISSSPNEGTIIQITTPRANTY